jgi:DNA-binding LytR/AlgR family response regulator
MQIVGADMRIRIELTEDITEEEVIIRCAAVTEEVQKIQQAVTEVSEKSQKLELYKGEKQYYMPLEEILFFETDAERICAHTATEVFIVKFRLYELEQMLPGCFSRVSKSSILNTRTIYSITRNLSASSIVEFQNSYKTVYVSRYYYKLLRSTLEQYRGKN